MDLSEAVEVTPPEAPVEEIEEISPLGALKTVLSWFKSGAL